MFLTPARSNKIVDLLLLDMKNMYHNQTGKLAQSSSHYPILTHRLIWKCPQELACKTHLSIKENSKKLAKQQINAASLFFPNQR